MYKPRTDETVVYNAFIEEANNRVCYGRQYATGRYGLLVRILEYKPGRFLLSASVLLQAEKRIKKSRTRRERPLRPSYDELGEVRWQLLREGVYADFPWSDEQLEGYIEETLNLLRSPQIPRHYQLHGDYSDEDLA
jgi:hypothetical protein